LSPSVAKKIKKHTRVLVGIPFMEITREVLRRGHDLVIKMARGDDVRRSQTAYPVR
jgi:hypothetical protein